MLWALVAAIAMLVGSSVAVAENPEQHNAVAVPAADPRALSEALHPSPTEDPGAERDLLELANESRKRAGVPPLHLDPGLTQAAREHARLMVENGNLSHQFAGEAALLQRVADASTSSYDRAGENVAYDVNVRTAHVALMNSPHHRENLLDSSFNAAGMAAIWSKGRLYVVEDFGHALPTYSAAQARQFVAKAIGEVRKRHGLAPVTEVAAKGLDAALCSMVRDSRISARPLNVSYPSSEVITYTQSQPQTLPAAAAQAASNSRFRQVAIGACYGRDGKYPAGMYWIAILLN